MLRALLAVVLAGGCIEANLVVCGDGRACPVGTTCIVVSETMDAYCAYADELDACTSVAALDPCTPRDGDVGACYESSAGLVCLPSGCGNALTDRDEVCDDANNIVGDGCAPGCMSDETCGNGVVDSIKNETCDDGDLVGHDGCASECAPESPRWEQVVHASPQGRYEHGMVYDTARGRFVMFGGALSQNVVDNQTWESDGIGWQLINPPVSPSKRRGFAMAYDAGRQRVVMFGGAPTASSIGAAETWEWDGTTWLLRPTATTPPARIHSAAAYDPVRKRVVMFGGRGANLEMNDTWEYDGTNWTEVLPPVRPAKRGGHSLVYDPSRAVMVMVGGNAVVNSSTDTWEYDGAVWTQRQILTPNEMVGAAVAFDGTGIVALANASGSPLATVYRLTDAGWTNVFQSGNGRRYAAIAGDPVRRRLMLFGGTQEPCGATCLARSDTLVFVAASNFWTAISSLSPDPRLYATTAFDPLHGKVVMVGGANIDGPASAETWLYDGAHWTYVASNPGQRWGSAMAWDAKRRNIVLFGGSTSAGAANDTWIWDGQGWTEAMPVNAPPVMTGHVLEYDPQTERVILFGLNDSDAVRHTWAWDGINWTDLAPATMPRRRWQPAFALDRKRGRIVLAGGHDYVAAKPVPVGDVWEWTGTTWEEMPTQPLPRSSSALAWDAAREQTVLFSGAASVEAAPTTLADTWERSGGDWSQLPTQTLPSPRYGHAMFPHPSGAGVLVFGGRVEGFDSAELWRLQWSHARRYESCPNNTDTDGDGLAGCADPDCWTKCTPLCPPETTCDPQAPRCGDGVCNADLETCRLCPLDCSCTPWCGDYVCDPNETGCPGDCS